MNINFKQRKSKRLIKNIVAILMGSIFYGFLFWTVPWIMHTPYSMPYLQGVLLMHGICIGLLCVGTFAHFIISWILSDE